MILLNIVSFGAINWDISLFIDRLPSPDEEVLIRRISRAPGGTAANVAVASARILGIDKVAFLGAVGDDDIGRLQIRMLKNEGVVTDAVKIVKGLESGQAYILIDKYGKNMINTYFGANLAITSSYISQPDVEKVLDYAKVFVVMDPPLEVGIDILKIYSKKLLTIWDPGVYVDLGLESLKKGLEYTDIFIINEVESNILFGSVKPDWIMKKVVDLNRKIKIIVKRGVGGSMLVNTADNKVVEISSVPMKKLNLEVVNTVGCGDAFIGALASYLSEDYSIIESIKYGNCAGAYKATRYETRGFPTRTDLEDICSKASEYMTLHMYSEA